MQQPHYRSDFSQVRLLMLGIGKIESAIVSHGVLI